MSVKTISGYTTTLECISMEYPFEQSIRSLLGFCDEVIVVDGGSKDGTLERLEKIAAQEARLKVHVSEIDYSKPNWALYQDGYLKARARAYCTADFCWQNDNDEVIAEYDFERIRRLPDLMGATRLLMLPLIEYWGGFDKVRGDFFSWKPRFSVNDPRITHGIPRDKCCYDIHGYEYARPFDSDSCNYIYRDTREAVPLTVPRLDGCKEVDKMSSEEWQKFYFDCLIAYPHVHHVSWLDLRRKIRHHKMFWHRFHASMYNLKLEDTAERNMMFDKPWSEVSEQDIEKKAQELKELGPRFFHHKMDNQHRGVVFDFKQIIPLSLINWAKERNFPLPSHLATGDSDSSITRIIELQDSRLPLPLVSLVVNAQAGIDLLEATLQSLDSQHYRNIEVLIVYDRNDLQAKERICQFELQYQQVKLQRFPKLLGSSADAWNHGIRSARGDFVLPLLSGDRLMPEALAYAVEALQQTGGNVYVGGIQTASAEPMLPQSYNPQILRYKNLMPLTGIFHRALWDRVGGFDRSLSVAEFWNFWLSSSSRDMRVVTAEEVLLKLADEEVWPGRCPSNRDSYLPLLKISQSQLYPVSEVLNAHHELAACPLPIHLFECGAQIYEDCWLSQFVLGLLMEHSGHAEQSLRRYLIAVQVSGEKQWQALLRAAELLRRNGQLREAQQFLEQVAFLRPDMKAHAGGMPFASIPSQSS